MSAKFKDRLREAADHAGVPYSPAAIGNSLGIARQKVHSWMAEIAEPRPAMIFHIADLWHVDPRWLATGVGRMAPPPGGPGLSADEMKMLKRYREAAPSSRPSLMAMMTAMVKSFAKTAGVAVLITTAGTLGFNKTSFAGDFFRPQLNVNTHCAAFLRRLRRAFTMLTRSERLISI